MADWTSTQPPSFILTVVCASDDCFDDIIRQLQVHYRFKIKDRSLMCFSATASFASSTVLFTIGAIAMRKSITPAQRLFAAIPLIFAIQQFCEGLLWLSLTNDDLRQLRQPTTYLFLIFAQVVWPTFVPGSILALEKDSKRRNIIGVFLTIGVAVSMYLGYCLLVYPVGANIDCYHINYDLHFPQKLMFFMGVLYFIATVMSPMISGNRLVRFLGVTILISYLVTRIFYTNYLISVWCYFAAIISLLVLAIIYDLNRTPSVKQLNVI